MSLRLALKNMAALCEQLSAQIADAEKHADPPHIKGYRFQKWFREECRKRRMPVRRKTGSSHVDLIVNSKRVQCKNLTPNASGQVFLQPGQSTYYMPKDFDVLAMLCCDRLYIIPIDALPKTNGHITIQIRPVRMHRWVDAWHVFGDFVFAADQKTLFEGESLDGR